MLAADAAAVGWYACMRRQRGGSGGDAVEESIEKIIRIVSNVRTIPYRIHSFPPSPHDFKYADLSARTGREKCSLEFFLSEL